MGKHNYYAIELDAAFKQAREKYRDLYAAVCEAEQEYTHAIGGMNAARIDRAHRALDNARFNMQSKQKTVWNGFFEKAGRLRAELEDEIYFASRGIEEIPARNETLRVWAELISIAKRCCFWKQSVSNTAEENLAASREWEKLAPEKIIAASQNWDKLAGELIKHF